MNHGMHFHLAPGDMGDLRVGQVEAMTVALREMAEDQRKARRG